LKTHNEVILLIPHYNNVIGLKKSLKSIGIAEEIDVLIVDDGSKQNCIVENEVSACFKANGTVFFKYLITNLGIEHALNAGLEFILKNNYKYTARLDCGDLCNELRFKKQYTFLQKNKDISLVGTNVKFYSTQNKFLYALSLPELDEDIRKKMFLNAMFIHPTIMFSNHILKKTGFYPTNYKAAEDFAFFFKVLKYYKVANINEFLVDCELNSNGISKVQRNSQAKNRIKIILENFYFGFYPIYGILRSLLLLILPVWFLLQLKKFLK